MTEIQALKGDKFKEVWQVVIDGHPVGRIEHPRCPIPPLKGSGRADGWGR